MPAHDQLIEKARSRFEELDNTIKAAERVKEEWDELSTFLALADQMSERLFGQVQANGQMALPSGTTVGKIIKSVKGSGGQLTIPDRAEQIIRKRGALHLKELFKEMRFSGWKATGDDTKDLKNLASSVRTRPKRFKNVGNNTWDLVSR